MPRLGGYCSISANERGVSLNAVEIEEAVSRFAEAPFDPEAFPDASEKKTGANQPVKRKTKRADA